MQITDCKLQFAKSIAQQIRENKGYTILAAMFWNIA